MGSGIAFEIPRFLVGVWPANIDMSLEATYQFSVVDLVYVTGTGVTGFAGAALGAPVSAGSPALGVLQNNPQLNEAGTVMITGISKAKIGIGGVALNQLLATDTDGTLIAAGSGQYAIAKALMDASQGDVAAVLLSNYGKQ